MIGQCDSYTMGQLDNVHWIIAQWDNCAMRQLCNGTMEQWEKELTKYSTMKQQDYITVHPCYCSLFQHPLYFVPPSVPNFGYNN